MAADEDCRARCDDITKTAVGDVGFQLDAISLNAAAVCAPESFTMPGVVVNDYEHH
jgi:hypothetical protein